MARKPEDRAKVLLRVKRWQAANRERNLASRKAWRDRNRETLNAISREYNRTHRAEMAEAHRVWSAKNRERLTELARKWRAGNPDRMRANGRAYYQRNREKLLPLLRAEGARRRGATGSHTAKDELRIMAEQGGRCAYCGVELANRKVHLDHKTPLCRGGTDNPNNLCFACASCNLHKHKKTAQEFIASGRANKEVSA